MNSFQRTVLEVLLLAACYALTGALGLLLAIPPGYATAVWPPSGVALAALLIVGLRIAPGIWLGSFLLNAWVGYVNGDLKLTSLAVAASIGFGSTLQAVLSAIWLRPWLVKKSLFQRGTAILAFAGIASLCCFIAASWGVATLRLAGALPAEHFWETWLTWWLGDWMGVLIITPLALSFPDFINREQSYLHNLEILASLLVHVAVAALVFLGPVPIDHQRYPLAFLPLPCLVWIAFRFAPGGVALASFLL